MVRGDNSLFFATGLDNSGLASGSLDAVSIITSLGQKISKINPFAALAVGAISAFAIIAKESFKVAKNFEQAMKEVQTISSAVQKDFEGISKEVFDLTKITPDNPEKVARAFYQIVSAGFDGAEGLKLLEVGAKAAVAGVTDTATAADGITTILNAYKKEASEAEAVSDALFNTVKLGKTTYNELAASISNIAPIASASNIPLNEILSTIATLTKQGVPTAQSTTQIRAAIVGLQKAGELDGAKTFQENMQALYDSVDGNQTALLEEVGSVEALQAILAVAGKNAKSATADLESYQTVVGATEEAFTRMATSNVNQWQILRNRIRAGTKGIGDAVLAISSNVAEGLNEILEPLDSVVASLEKERLELLKVESKIKDVNTSNEDRLKIINELKEKYPQLLKDIDAETVSNNDLSISIAKINDQLINQIVLREKEREVEDQNKTTAEKKIELIRQEEKVREQLVKLAEKEGKTIKDNATLTEQARDLFFQFSESQRRAGRAVSPIVEFGFQIAQLEALQKSLNFEEKQGAKILSEKEALAKRLGIVLKSNADDIKNTDPTPSPVTDPEDDSTYAEFLQKRKDEYESYENFIIQLGKEKADERFENLLKEGEDYGKFLQNQLDQAKSFAEERAVIDAAADAGIIIKRKPIEKVELAVEVQPIVQEIVIDETSINVINRRLEKLNKEYVEAQTDAEREILAEKIKIEKEKLKQAERFLNEEEGLYGNLQRSISDLRNKELRSYIELWQKKLRVAKEGSAEAAEAEGNIQNAQEQIGQNTANTIQEIVGILNEASALFRKFGDEDTARLLNQLSDVANGIGTIAAAGGDPLKIAKGVLEIANSALKIEVVSDTANFEKVIKDLENSIDRLDFVISKSLGQDKITSRLDAIDDLKKLEEQADRAKEAELEARKEVKLLGITISKKGSGSGTDPAKLEELEQKAEDARRKVEELKTEINELYTGATQSTLADSIIDGFREGKRSAEDFAETFEELMRNAIFEALKIKYLEKASNDFFEQFGALAGDDDGLTAADISNLSNLADQIFSSSVKELEALNKILEEAGIAGGVFGDTRKQSLAGSISTITEDTANILSGTLNSIRLDIATGLSIAGQSSLYLSQIALNTGYNKHLESIDLKIGEIRSSLNQFESQGLG